MCGHWTRIAWLGLLIYSTSIKQVLGNNRDSSSPAATSKPAGRQDAAERLPDVVLKGIIVIRFKTLPYIRELYYRERILTKRLISLCEKEMNKLFYSVKGKQTAKIDSFRRDRRGALIVVMDLDSTGNDNATDIMEMIKKKIRIPGKFVHYQVDKRMATFQPQGVFCQPKVHYAFDYHGERAVYDDSGFDNNAVVKGRMHVTNRGKCGKAVKFTRGYITLKNFKDTKTPGTNSIVIMFWIRLSNPRSSSSILRGYYNGSVIQVLIQRGFVVWTYITRDETIAFHLRHRKLLPARYWTHIACVHNPYKKKAELYINSNLVAQSTVRKDLVKWRFNSWLQFGLLSSQGYLDDLYVYDCALGVDVIKEIKTNCGCPERCAPRGKNEYLIRMELVYNDSSEALASKITKKVENEILKMFEDTSGDQQVQTVGYRPVDVDSLMVDYSLHSIGNSNTRFLAGILQPAVTSGNIGGVQLASDEVKFVPMSGSSVCQSSEMKCNDGECINKLWKCDGDINCADGSDEVDCGGHTVNMECNSREFQCNTSRIYGINDCVEKRYRCDGQLDCEDDSDERDCAPPRLITAPRSLIILAKGETATCTCVATGVPTPKVSWHKFGREISSQEGKIHVSSESGYGVLRIYKLEKEDSGDYICMLRDNRVKKVIAPSCTIQVRDFGKVCVPPFFNSIAQSSSHCLRCFCHGATDNCRSAQLFRSKIFSRWNCDNCDVDGPTLVDETGQNFELPDTDEPITTRLFWELPKKYVGNKLTSYGGLLTYSRDAEFLQGSPRREKRNVRVDNEWKPTSNRTETTISNYVSEVEVDESWFGDENEKSENNVPMVKGPPTLDDLFNTVDTRSGPNILNLTGQYGVMIVGNDGTHLVPSKPLYFNGESTEIRLTEDDWNEKGKGSFTTRMTILRVLADIKHIYIDAKSSGRVSSLLSVSMETAVEEDNGNEEVVYVEQCACPMGYEGLSCEKCSAGYFRARLTNKCIKCTCYNHSRTCHSSTGVCQNCAHGTEGDNCEKCKPGSYGDPTKGTANDCKPCRCPLASETNQFSKTCYLHSDGKPICSPCQKGYAGRNCERCAEGYEGNPLVVGGNCYKVGNFSQCDMRGSVSQNTTADGEIKCTCKKNAVGSVCDECRPGTFNLLASNPSGCERCFCARVSSDCSSLIGTRTTIYASFDEDRFQLKTIHATGPIHHLLESSNGEIYLRKVFLEGPGVKRALYWNLPSKFTGSKVASYDGYLEYTVTHSWNGTKDLSRAYDVVLATGRYGIFYVGRQLKNKNYLNNQRQTFRVSLNEKFWRFSSGSLVSKTLFLVFLARLERLLILATPKVQMKETRLHSVKMDIAVETTKNSGKIFPGIEKCFCPLGYTGYSCEICAEGYAPSSSNLLRRCKKCNCNGHASKCDQQAGKCKDCQHNTYGDHCEKCKPGYYGDATTGSEAACRPCPCPYTSLPNRFSPTCYLGDDGLPVCDQCPEGHEGRRCERCKESYVGNPEVIGDFCKPVTSCGCDPRGSTSKDCDQNTKQCFCKKNVEGEKCNKCKRGFYNLQEDNADGCTKCFCMGFDTSCQSWDHYRDPIKFSPHSLDLPDGFSIITEDLSQNTSDFVVDLLNKRVRFLNQTWLERPNIYWTLPGIFLGSQVTSYGGILSISLSVFSSNNTTFGRGNAVKITGNGITLHYRDIKHVPSNKVKLLNIRILESHWQNSDGTAVSRDDLMRVLADIEAIMVRASYTKGTIESSIRRIEMNAATDDNSRRAKATEIEFCKCPPTTDGFSCERCSPGYTKMGRPTARCIRCRCNSHSNQCDGRTGICQNCNHNTAGNSCERCARGYYGDATKGTIADCKQCPCPLPDHRFSETCFIDKDGSPTCDACQEGYSGRRCEKCSLNYTGNPLTPGGKCFKVPVELIPNVKIIPKSITVQEGDNARFECIVKSIRPAQIVWSRIDGSALPSNARVTGNILSFRSLNKSDAGTYVCAASNDIALRTAQTVLIVKKQQLSAVIVTVSPKSRYIPIGGTAKFACTSKTSSRYSITWTRENNKPMPLTAHVQDGTLIVSDAKLGDGGTYICTGKNALNIDRAIISLHVGVVVKPQASVSPQRQIVDVAEAVKFRCSDSAGFPAATLRWKRGDGKRLPRFSKFLSRVGIFKIIAASRRDEGEYMCIASNSGGDSVMKVQLLVKGPNSLPKASVTPKDLTIEEGQDALLRCEFSGDEKLDIRWKKQGGTIPKSAVVTRNTLEIRKTTYYDRGTYICLVKNRYGRAQARARLNINKDTSKSERIFITPKGTVISVIEGKSLVLECHVSGITKPVVQWKRLFQDKIIGNQAKLYLRDIKMDDTGIYVCFAKTEGAEEKAMVSVVVERNRILPRVQVTPNNIATSTGRKITLKCKVSSKLPVSISWSRADGSPLGSKHSIRNNNLVIHNIRKKDEGTYICLAQNRFGASKATAELVVFNRYI